MKSIIEQGASIGKAIQKAWDRAEQPKEFSVKVFEGPKRGFLGFNSKPAKVGIFFQEVPQSKRVVTKRMTTKPVVQKKNAAVQQAEKKRIMPKDLTWLAQIFGVLSLVGLLYWLYAVCKNK